MSGTLTARADPAPVEVRHRPKMLWDLSSLALGQLLSVVLGFAGFAWLARTLPLESYGLVEYAVGLAGLAAIVIEGGTGPIGTLRVSREPARAREVAARVPMARILLAMVVVPLVGLSSVASGFDATSVTLTWLVALSLVLPVHAFAQGTYYPTAATWQKRTPAQVGLVQSSVDSAVKIALASESTTPRDLLQNHVASSFSREPHSEAVGPFTVRGGASGLIIRRGYIVAEWGDIDRPENTYSVTKSFVSTTIGLAYDRKMIRNLNDPVHQYMPPVVALKGPPHADALQPPPYLRRTIVSHWFLLSIFPRRASAVRSRVSWTSQRPSRSDPNAFSASFIR